MFEINLSILEAKIDLFSENVKIHHSGEFQRLQFTTVPKFLLHFSHHSKYLMDFLIIAEF